MTTYFHTSPVEIKKINSLGLFGENLFFSEDVYTMTASDTVYVYSIEIDEDDIIAARELHDKDIIIEIAELFECEEEEAEFLLDGRANEWSMENCDAEKSWTLQKLRGDCAKKMGCKACEDEDEQGTVLIVPMLGRETELTLVEVKL